MIDQGLPNYPSGWSVCRISLLCLDRIPEHGHPKPVRLRAGWLHLGHVCIRKTEGFCEGERSCVLASRTIPDLASRTSKDNSWLQIKLNTPFILRNIFFPLFFLVYRVISLLSSRHLEDSSAGIRGQTRREVNEDQIPRGHTQTLLESPWITLTDARRLGAE